MNKNQPLATPHTITIGSAEGNTIRIQKGGISRQHAILTIQPNGSYLLEDQGSKRGTSVNGIEIKSLQVKPEDQVAFGSHTYLLKDLLIQAHVIEKEKDPLDFTEEFAKMKTVYDSYLIFKTEEHAIKEENDKKKRKINLFTALIAFLSLWAIKSILSSFVQDPSSQWVASVLASTVLTPVIKILLEGFFKPDELLKKPHREFNNNWKCPKCGDKTTLYGKSWETLAHQKKCKKCDAIWVK